MRWLAAFAMSGLLSTGCTVTSFSGTVGSGPIQTEQRTGLATFTGVVVGGGMSVTLSIGSTPSVELRAQENILPLIQTTVRDGTLEVSTTGSYSTSQVVEVTIVTQQLDRIQLSGGAVGTMSGISADHLNVTVSGGARLTGTGTGRDLEADASGGAQLHLYDLDATSVTISASGGALAELSASDRVTGDASGGAHVSVHGDATVNVQASGGASVDS